jgi:hypothetical protein
MSKEAIRVEYNHAFPRYPGLCFHQIYLLIITRWWWLNIQVCCACQRSERDLRRVFFCLSHVPTIVEKPSGIMNTVYSCNSRPCCSTAFVHLSVRSSRSNCVNGFETASCLKEFVKKERYLDDRKRLGKWARAGHEQYSVLMQHR